MKKSWMLDVVLCCLFSFIATTVNASLAVPTGLNPGDTYHVIFATSTATQATSTDIAFYDDFVQSTADAAGIGTTIGLNNWRAVGSTSAVDAVDHLSPLFSSTTDVPIYTQLGDLVASSYSALWATGPQVPINVDEQGMEPDLPQVWTGSTGAGTAAPNDELGAAVGGARFGNTTVGPTWIDSSTAGSDNFFHMYALSQEITIAPIPPAPVTIDIKPSKKTNVNVISLKKDKNLKVAIVGSDAFDALRVDPTTVKFGPSKASPVRYMGKDYNKDGYSDLILTFKLKDTGIDLDCTVGSATLTGQTFPGPVINITGSDTFTVEPCP